MCAFFAHCSYFTYIKVGKKLLDVNPDKQSAPTGWPLLLLKETADQTCIYLIHYCLKITWSQPQDWKSAQVTPIFEQGNRQPPNNYQPTSQISSVV